jgi:hypothetical protein
MQDIIEQLRTTNAVHFQWLMDRAADEIERLRKQIAELEK